MKQAVGVIIQNIDGDVLLMKRSMSSGHDEGKWENCGGKVEEGETFEDCAKREAMEELGVEVTSLKLEYIDKPDAEHEIHIFTAQIAGEPRLMETKMCDEIKWFKKSELNETNLAPYSRQDFINLKWISPVVCD